MPAHTLARPSAAAALVIFARMFITLALAACLVPLVVPLFEQPIRLCTYFGCYEYRPSSLGVDTDGSWPLAGPVTAASLLIAGSLGARPRWLLLIVAWALLLFPSVTVCCFVIAAALEASLWAAVRP